jgi:hypothetical protein
VVLGFLRVPAELGAEALIFSALHELALAIAAIYS